MENYKGKFEAVKRHQNMHNIVKFGLILKVKGTESFKSWSGKEIVLQESHEAITGGFSFFNSGTEFYLRKKIVEEEKP